MLPHKAESIIRALDSKVKLLDDTLNTLESCNTFSQSIQVQAIASNYLAIAACGLVEVVVQEILYDFTRNNSSPKTASYVRSKLNWVITLNCPKIDALLRAFDPEWGILFNEKTSDRQKYAINSLRNLRNQLAHGKHNGTGYPTVRRYYEDSKCALRILANIVN